MRVLSPCVCVCVCVRAYTCVRSVHEPLSVFAATLWAFWLQKTISTKAGLGRGRSGKSRKGRVCSCERFCVPVAAAMRVFFPSRLRFACSTEKDSSGWSCANFLLGSEAWHLQYCSRLEVRVWFFAHGCLFAFSRQQRLACKYSFLKIKEQFWRSHARAKACHITSNCQLLLLSCFTRFFLV